MANRREEVVPVGPSGGKRRCFRRLRWTNLVDFGWSMDQPQVVPIQPGPTFDPRGWSMKWSRLPVLEGPGQPGQPFSRFSHAASSEGVPRHRGDADHVHLQHGRRGIGRSARSASRASDSAIVVAARLGVLAPGWHGELVGGRPVRAWFNGRPADPNEWERAAERVLVAFAVRTPKGPHARAYAALLSAKQARERFRARGRTRAEHRPQRGPMRRQRRRRRLHLVPGKSRGRPRAPDEEPANPTVAQAASLRGRRLP